MLERCADRVFMYRSSNTEIRQSLLWELWDSQICQICRRFWNHALGHFGWSDCTRGWFDQLRHTKSSISSRCRHPRGWLCPLRHWIKLGWNLKRANIVHMVLECCFERFALQMFLAVTSARLRYGILVQFWNLKPGRLCNGRWPDRLASQGQIRQVLRATMLSIRWFVKSWIRPLPQLQGRQYEYLSDLP